MAVVVSSRYELGSVFPDGRQEITLFATLDDGSAWNGYGGRLVAGENPAARLARHVAAAETDIPAMRARNAKHLDTVAAKRKAHAYGKTLSDNQLRTAIGMNPEEIAAFREMTLDG